MVPISGRNELVREDDVDEVIDITPDKVIDAIAMFMQTTGKSPTKLNVSHGAERALKVQLASRGHYEAKEGGDTFMGLPLVRCEFGWFVS